MSIGDIFQNIIAGPLHNLIIEARTRAWRTDNPGEPSPELKAQWIAQETVDMTKAVGFFETTPFPKDFYFAKALNGVILNPTIWSEILSDPRPSLALAAKHRAEVFADALVAALALPPAPATEEEVKPVPLKTKAKKKTK